VNNHEPNVLNSYFLLSLLHCHDDPVVPRQSENVLGTLTKIRFCCKQIVIVETPGISYRKSNQGFLGRQGNFAPELRALWIGIEIEIAIEIGTLPEIDFDHDFDFDELCPTLGIPREQPPTYRSEIMKIFQRKKRPCPGKTGL
jgi:hypothetical protein